MTACPHHQPQTAGTKANPEALPTAAENNRGEAELALQALADALPAIIARFIEALLRLFAAWRAGDIIEPAPLPPAPRAPCFRARAPRRTLPRRRHASKARPRTPRRTRAPAAIWPRPVPAAQRHFQNPPRAFFSSA